MRKSFKSIVAGAAALCVVGVMSAVGATSASAAPAPFDPTPDPNWIGTVAFYNAAGQVVTSGDGLNPLSAQYMVGSANPPGVLPTTRTIVALVGPQPAVNPGLWSGANLNGSTVYPLPAPAPAVVSSATTPQGEMIAASTTFYGSSSVFVPNTGALANMFQIRLKSVGTSYYNATTIFVDPVTKVWQQIDPVVADSTKTVLAVSGANPGTAPASTTLTATVTRTAAATGATAPVGNVQFMDGAATVGGPVAVNASGVATVAQTALPVGSHTYSAVFTPTVSTVFITSTSSTVAYAVVAGLTATNTALSAGSAAPFQGVAETFTASVTPAAATGTFQFFDNSTTSLGAASTATTLTTSTLALGAHSITAVFVPDAASATYAGSTSLAVTVNVVLVPPVSCSLPGSSCTDAQNFQATVPAGSIVISTPYHGSNPFNIGTMVLNAAGNQYTASNAFGNAANPTNGVTITDTRAGGLGWTASLQSGAFTNTTAATGSINAGNLGFTGVAPQYINGNALNLVSAGGNVVSVFDNAAPTLALAPAAAGSGLANPQKFASALIGAGSVYVTGTFTLNAPSSVPAGTYGGIVTFTIA